jgi:hypothetical protein
MKTRTTLRSILRLSAGCLLCLIVAALGFYPFADNRRGRSSRAGAYLRRGIGTVIG